MLDEYVSNVTTDQVFILQSLSIDNTGLFEKIINASLLPRKQAFHTNHYQKVIISAEKNMNALTHKHIRNNFLLLVVFTVISEKMHPPGVYYRNYGINRI